MRKTCHACAVKKQKCSKVNKEVDMGETDGEEEEGKEEEEKEEVKGKGKGVKTRGKGLGNELKRGS